MKVGLKKPESLGYMTVDTCVLYKTFCKTDENKVDRCVWNNTLLMCAKNDRNQSRRFTDVKKTKWHTLF